MAEAARYDIVVDVKGSQELVQFTRAVKQTQGVLREQGKAFPKAAGGAAAYNSALRANRVASGQFTNNMRNMGYQLNDVFVQLEMGTNGMRIFSQQFPQMVQGLRYMGGSYWCRCFRSDWLIGSYDYKLDQGIKRACRHN